MQIRLQIEGAMFIHEHFPVHENFVDDSVTPSTLFSYGYETHHARSEQSIHLTKAKNQVKDSSTFFLNSK